MFVYRQVGVSLPHSSRAQIGYGERVSRANLQPGRPRLLRLADPPRRHLRGRRHDDPRAAHRCTWCASTRCTRNYVGRLPAVDRFSSRPCSTIPASGGRLLALPRRRVRMRLQAYPEGSGDAVAEIDGLLKLMTDRAAPTCTSRSGALPPCGSTAGSSCSAKCSRSTPEQTQTLALGMMDERQKQTLREPPRDRLRLLAARRRPLPRQRLPPARQRRHDAAARRHRARRASRSSACRRSSGGSPTSRAASSS